MIRFDAIAYKSAVTQPNLTPSRVAIEPLPYNELLVLAARLEPAAESAFVSSYLRHANHRRYWRVRGAAVEVSSMDNSFSTPHASVEGADAGLKIADFYTTIVQDAEASGSITASYCGEVWVVTMRSGLAFSSQSSPCFLRALALAVLDVTLNGGCALKSNPA